MSTIGLFLQVPDWLTKELVIEILQSKLFAIYYGGAAVLALVGYLGRAKILRARSQKTARPTPGEGEGSGGKGGRASVKSVIGQALRKARGLPARGISFNPSDVFQQAALLCAQRQPHLAIEVLKKEATLSEATIGHAQHQLRFSQERAATASLQIGRLCTIPRQGTGSLDAFTAMLR